MNDYSDHYFILSETYQNKKELVDLAKETATSHDVDLIVQTSCERYDKEMTVGQNTVIAFNLEIL